MVSRLGLGALRSQVACATTSFHAKGLASAAAGEVAAKEDFFAQYKEAKAVADSVSLDQAVKEFEKTKKSSPLASKDWWGEAANKSEYYDNPEALEATVVPEAQLRARRMLARIALSDLASASQSTPKISQTWQHSQNTFPEHSKYLPKSLLFFKKASIGSP